MVLSESPYLIIELRIKKPQLLDNTVDQYTISIQTSLHTIESRTQMRVEMIHTRYRVTRYTTNDEIVVQ